MSQQQVRHLHSMKSYALIRSDRFGPSPRVHNVMRVHHPQAEHVQVPPQRPQPHACQVESTSTDVLTAGVSQHAYIQLMAFFSRRIFTMVSTLRSTRLRVATTACTYFHRFFCLKSLTEHDPRAVLAACIYLAGASISPSLDTHMQG
jgi:hypothetical protein